MKEATYRKIILKYLESQKGEWVYGYLLERNQTPFGWLGPRGMRTAREMACEGLIERRIEPGGKLVQYRWLSYAEVVEKPLRYEVITDAITGKEIARIPISG